MTENSLINLDKKISQILLNKNIELSGNNPKPRGLSNDYKLNHSF